MRSASGTFIPANSTIHQYLCRFHTGRANPIKAKDLAIRFDTDLRAVNEEIRQLRKSGILIGSTKSGAAGYYIPANEEEAKEYLSTFKSELFDMLETFNRQKRARKLFIDSKKTNDLFLRPETSGQLTFV